jgi:hypothetical protein
LHQAPPQQERQQQQPARTSPPEQILEARRPPTQQQQQPQQQQQLDHTMDYEPSHQAYAGQLIQDDVLLHSTGTIPHHHDTINTHDTARDLDGVFNQ